MTTTSHSTVTSATAFEPSGMKARREAYFKFVRQQALKYFTPDGEYRPNIEPDRRITYWAFPALIHTEDPVERELALQLLSKDPCWSGWGIFHTPSIASILVRDRHRLTPELISRAEDHLNKNVLIDDGKKPCSAANDYQFHGYNDNMPGMAVRSMVFGGQVLSRKDLTDLGVYYLQGLCAHFERRGLLSEYNSGTYTAITLAALLDVAECATHKESAEMARVCADRILMDIVAHWHMDIGHPVGSTSRAYLTDQNRTLSNLNAMAWYVGLPHTVDIIAAVDSPPREMTIHHGPDTGFAMAQFCEVMVADFSTIRPEIKAWAREPRSYPYEVRATSDAGRTAAIQDRAWVARLWSLGTASKEMWARQAGQHLVFHPSLARHTPVRSFKDRVSFWHILVSGGHDLGDVDSAGYGGFKNEHTHTNDHGQYHTIQNKGSALVLANAGTGLIDKDLLPAKFIVAGSVFGVAPDEMYGNDTALQTWDGATDGQSWQFMRFGQVYVGLRMAGVMMEKPLAVRRSTKNGYYRVEVIIEEEKSLVLTRELREWLDLGFVFEISDESETGSFAEFRRQCLGTTWEYFHCFYRNSRYASRNGDLQIIDSIEPHDIRFMTVDNKIEESTRLHAPGLKPGWLDLFGDGRKVRQPRIMYRPDHVGTPFYPLKQNIVAADAKR